MRQAIQSSLYDYSSLHKREVNPCTLLTTQLIIIGQKNQKNNLLVSGAQVLPNVGIVFKKML